MGLPPDRAPRDEDWAWLNALAGHPEPGTEKRVLRETQLLAEALKAAMGGGGAQMSEMSSIEPQVNEMRDMAPPADELFEMDSLRDDVFDRFESDSSLSAQDFDDRSSKGVMASYEPSFSSAERISSRASALFSRTTSDDDGIFPEPTGNGFAKLKRRLRDAGLL